MFRKNNVMLSKLIKLNEALKKLKENPSIMIKEAKSIIYEEFCILMLY